MSVVSAFHPGSTLAVFGPPYEEFEAIGLSWKPRTIPPHGQALLWWLLDQRQGAELRWVAERPQGIPLFIVLPPPSELARVLPLLSQIDALDPRAVLPTGRTVNPEHLRELLRAAPRHFAGAVTAYLSRRRLLKSGAIRLEVQRILEAVPETSSISKLARRLYVSRRTLGRHFAAAGLPVPSHWLQFARLLHAITRLQNDNTSVFRVAARAGYPDGFTMSNQMKRLIGCRPTEVRSLLGWEWVVECWIAQEARAGRIDPIRHHDAVSAYLECDGGAVGDLSLDAPLTQDEDPHAISGTDGDTEDVGGS